MAEAVEQARQEFWRPPVIEATTPQDRTKTCDECGTEFIVGARYCHSCGASRPGLTTASIIEFPGLGELTALGKRLGLTAPALVAFLLGAFCLVATVSVGILFTARTSLDWQAIQLWRIEWLLGAIASFAAGSLLKRKSS